MIITGGIRVSKCDLGSLRETPCVRKAQKLIELVRLNCWPFAMRDWATEPSGSFTIVTRCTFSPTFVTLSWILQLILELSLRWYPAHRSKWDSVGLQSGCLTSASQADVPEIVDGLVKDQPVKRLVITADQPPL